MTTVTVTRDAGHTYYRAGDTTGYPSVTTIVNATVGEAGLVGWARRHAIEYVLEQYRRGAIDVPAGHGTAADVLETYATRDALRKADLGTDVHKAIEDYIGGKLTRVGFDKMAPELQRHMREFWAWEKDAKPAWTFSEEPFVDECHGYGGTADAGGTVVGMAGEGVMDWKTGRRTWLEHILQLAAYKHAFEQQGREIQWTAILQVRAGEPAKWKPIPLTPRDFDVFLTSLDRYRWMKEKANVLG